MTARAPAESRVTITVDGRPTVVAEGVTVAAALVEAAVVAFRRSPSGEARGPVCGMGTCYECRVAIDGVAHRRACLMIVAEGMEILTANGHVDARQ